jgi:hypothetical protein
MENSTMKLANSGPLFYNYKDYCSIVIMAVVNKDYEFIYVNASCNGQVADGGIIDTTDF